MKHNTPFTTWTIATKRRICALATGLVLLYALAMPASGYEAAQTLQASKVLPAALRSGAHFRVDDKSPTMGMSTPITSPPSLGRLPPCPPRCWSNASRWSTRWW